MRRWIIVIALAVAFISFQSDPSPKVFDHGILSTGVETSLTFTPDGNTLFFARKDSFYVRGGQSTIFTSKKRNGSWSTPEIASFSGTHSDNDPFIAPDGQRLFFASNRTENGGGTKEDRDIWYMDKSNKGWGAPIRLDAINSAESEYSPTVDGKGNLYFGSYREGGKGWGDIWVSYFQNGNYQIPVNLGESINTEGGEWGSSISPDGLYLIFEASGREENITNDGDLYISFKENDVWSRARHLGDLNSSGSDLTPKIHGHILYFASNRHPDFFSFKEGNNNVDLYQTNLKPILDNLGK